MRPFSPVPWGNQQPGQATPLDVSNPLTFGLIDAFLPGQQFTASLVSNRDLTNLAATGLLTIAPGKYGVCGNFPANTTDAHYTSLEAAQTTFAFRARFKSDPSATTSPRIFDGPGYNTSVTTSNNSINFVVVGVGNGNFSTPASSITFGAGASFHNVIISFDASTSGNVPSIWIDGVAQTITTNTAYTAAHTSDAGTRYLFNRSDNLRGLEGDLEYFYQWNRVLDPREIATMGANPYRMYQPLARGLWSSAVTAVPSQIFTYCADEFDAIDDIDDSAAYAWYADDSTPCRATVPDQIDFDYNVEEAQYYIEDVFPDYYAQPPPADVFVVDPPQPSLEQEEPPEDEDYGFSTAPPVADFDDSLPFGSFEQEEPPEDEDFGFALPPLAPDFAPDQIEPELANLQLQDEDEFMEGFSDAPLAADVYDPPLPSLEVEEPPEDEDFGFSTAPLADDVVSDQVFVSTEVEEPPEDEDFGSSVDPLSADNLPFNCNVSVTGVVGYGLCGNVSIEQRTERAKQRLYPRTPANSITVRVTP